MINMFRKHRTMCILALYLLSPVMVLIYLVGSKAWAAYITSIENYHTPKLCKPSLHRAGGFTRTSLSLAEMSAVAAWVREVTVYGKDFNFWTNANSKVLRCKKVKGTVTFSCMAFGVPCKILHKKAPADLEIAKRSLSKTLKQ